VKRIGVIVVTVLLAGGALAGEPLPWLEIEPGLEATRFDTRSRQSAAKGDLVVVRIDPQRWDLRVLTAARDGGDEERNVRQWCEDFGLTLAINAGMFREDNAAHVGFLQIDGEIVSRYPNDYRSAAALDPVDPSEPVFRIFDLDETPLEEVRERYGTVVQNLRLIKRPRQNRWEPGKDKWRECALAEDGAGRVLLLACRTAWSMEEFNDILLALPLDIQAAQHLEGSATARLWLSHPELKGWIGGTHGGPALPNVLGVAPRPSP
jgi:hypothetical protein